MKKRLMLFAAMSLLAIGGAAACVDYNAKEEEPVVAKAAEAGEFPVIAKGSNKNTRIEGAMVFVYFDNTTLQIKGETKVSVTANLVCESDDPNQAPYVTGGHAAVVFNQFVEIQELNTNTPCLYMTLDKGMADGIEFYHKFDLTVTVNESDTYTAHVEFKGNKYIDPNAEPEKELTITETKEFSALSQSSIVGAGAEIWVDNTEIGLTGDNWKSLDVTFAFTTESDALKGHETGMKVTSKVIDSITNDKFRVFVILNVGLNNTDGDGKFTHTFGISFVKKTSDTEGVAYQNNSVVFKANKLYDPNAPTPDVPSEPTKLETPYGFVANVVDNNIVSFAWNGGSTTNATQVRVFVKDSSGADVVGLVDCPIGNGQTFGKNMFKEGETYSAYIVAKGDGVYYTDSDQSAVVNFSFAVTDPVDPDQPTKLPTPDGFVANVVDNNIVTFAWAGNTTDKAKEVRVFVRDSKGADVVGLVDCPIGNGQSFGKEKFVEGETYSAYLVAKGDGTEYVDSDQSAVVTFKFEVDVVKNFVTKWAEMRNKGGADGICAVARTEDSEFMALIQEFKTFTPEQQNAIRATEDFEGVTIGETMDYLSGRFEWFKNQNVSPVSNEANFLGAAIQNDTLLVVAVIGLASVLATVAYIYSEKKKIAKK